MKISAHFGKGISAWLIFIAIAMPFSFTARASLVVFASTNSGTGQLDTNTFRLISLSNVQNADGTFNTVGIPIVVKNPTGIVTNYLVQNNWLWTNPVTGFWDTLRTPDSSSNVITEGGCSLHQNMNPFITLIYYTNNPSSTNAYLQQVITPEQYGATFGTEVHDVTIANGSAVVNSPTANFSSTNVGQPLTLFLDTTNLTYLQTTIASVQSATQATLSAVTTTGWTNNRTIVFGKDDTTAIQTMVNAVHAAGGGVVKFQAGIYYLATPPQIRTNANNEDSVINLPCQFIRATSAAKKMTIEFDGAYAAEKGISVDTNYPELSGTIIYCPSVCSLPNTSTNINCIFGANDTNSDFSLEQYVFKNITVRKVRNSPLCGIFSVWGGGLVIEDSTFDVDYPLGDQLDPPNYIPLFIPTNSVVNPWTDTGIWTPGVNNDSNTKINRVMVYGYGCGIEMGEHCDAENSEFEFNGTGVSIFSDFQSTAIEFNSCGCQGQDFHLIGNTIQLSDWTNEYAAKVEFNGIFFENKANTTTEVHDTTGGIILGPISYGAFQPWHLNYTSTNIIQIWQGDPSYYPWAKGTWYGTFIGIGAGLTGITYAATAGVAGVAGTITGTINGPQVTSPVTNATYSVQTTNASGTGSAMTTNDSRAVTLSNLTASGTFTGNGGGLTNYLATNVISDATVISITTNSRSAGPPFSLSTASTNWAYFMMDANATNFQTTGTILPLWKYTGGYDDSFQPATNQTGINGPFEITTGAGISFAVQGQDFQFLTYGDSQDIGMSVGGSMVPFYYAMPGDGAYYTMNVHFGTPNWHYVTMFNCWPLVYVSVPATNGFLPKINQFRHTTAVLGDSFTEQSYNLAASCWGVICQLQVLRPDLNLIPLGEGGTGFVNPGVSGGTNFANRVADVLKANPEHVIVYGGINDLGNATNTSLTNSFYFGVTNTLYKLRQQVPNASILLVGPQTAQSATNDTRIGNAANLMSNGVAATLAALGGNIQYANSSGWITGYQTIPGSGNAPTYVDPVANPHPSVPAGTTYQASQINVYDTPMESAVYPNDLRGIVLTNYSNVFGGSIIEVQTNAFVAPPRAIAGVGQLWNSNNVLYFITTLHTNYIVGP